MIGIDLISSNYHPINKYNVYIYNKSMAKAKFIYHLINKQKCIEF
jgi:hypothetical protein